MTGSKAFSKLAVCSPSWQVFAKRVWDPVVKEEPVKPAAHNLGLFCLDYGLF